MKSITSSLALLALSSRHVLAHGDDETNMAPLGFMWPVERIWEDEHGMAAPCGSASGPKLERTLFPTSGGALALDGKQKVYDLQLAVSFSQDPKSNSDFTSLLSGVNSLDFEHVCIPMPALTGAEGGQNATLQLKYVAEWIDPHHSHKRHTETNETFYSCADVTFVEQAQFSFEIPCFNATAEEHGDHDEDHGHDHDHDDGLSKEAIAGIVIGCVATVAAIGLIGFYLYRKDRREKLLVRAMTEGVKL